MPARTRDVFGSVSPLSIDDIATAARGAMIGYRVQLQRAMSEGKTFDAAHRAARPILVALVAGLRAEGVSDRDIREAVAKEWHA